MKIGIIGGSGFENPEILTDFKTKEVETPFGKPSSQLTIGKIGSIDVFIISRHGLKHEIPPTEVNNRANIFALKNEGCKFIIATTAVGSLSEEIKRGDFIILDQFIDFTKHRKLTFFEKFEFGPIHTQMAEPFSEELRKKLIESCEELQFPVHKKGTVITIEGPRFSTKAESNLFKLWGANVINMSTSPEAILANEAEIPFATIATSTDYDCWKQDEKPVTWYEIKEIMKQNTEKLKKVLINTINSFSKEQEINKLKEKVRTIPNFQKEGEVFRDITTLLQDKESLRKLTELLYRKYKETPVDIVVGIDSKGFIIAGLLAEKLNAGLALIRKPNKSSNETLKKNYPLESGNESIEIPKDAIKPGDKVLIVDDLISTGESAKTVAELIEKAKATIIGCAFVIELPEFKGKEKLSKYPFFSLIKFEGE